MAFRRGLVLVLSALLFIVSPLSADSIDDAAAKARGVPVQQIQLENEEQKNADLQAKLADLQVKLRAAQADNATLKVQVEQLNAQIASMNPMPATDPKAQTSTQSSATMPTAEANTSVARAFQTFSNVVVTLNNSTDTDIQKRQKWFNAERDLDNLLAKNRVTISYSISNVVYNGKSGTAFIEVSSATIKSNDPQVVDVMISQPNKLTIVTDETSAGKITTKSPMTLEGIIHMGILNKPAPEQPAYVNEGMLMQPALVSENGLSGLLPVGRLTDIFHINGGILAGPLLLIRNSAVLKIGGIVQKFPLPAAANGRGG